jgi:hypothetical protein
MRYLLMFLSGNSKARITDLSPKENYFVFFLPSNSQIRVSDAVGQRSHWPMQLLAYGSFQHNSVLILNVLYHELTK